MNREKAASIVEMTLAAMKHWKSIARRNGCPDAEIRLFRPVFENRRKALVSAFSL